MAVLRPVDRIHLVQRILDLFVLLTAHVGALSGLASRQLEVEVDTRTELVHIDRVL